jgi:FtsP/CotA-like multicopper oxidase with cupredoxin domain
MQKARVHGRHAVRSMVLVVAAAALLGLLALPAVEPVTAQNGESGFYDAGVPAAGSQHVKQVTVVAQDAVRQIAPGVKVPLWTFNGSVPAPIIHVRQGDDVRVSRTRRRSRTRSIFTRRRPRGTSGISRSPPGSR